VNRTLYPLLAPFVISSNISIAISYLYFQNRLGCSVKKKKKRKKKKERKRKIKVRGQISQHRGILSGPSSPQSLHCSKKRYVFLQRSKSRIRYSPYFLYTIITTIYISTQPIFRITHMHILI
jgi:hypothetical protein